MVKFKRLIPVTIQTYRNIYLSSSYLNKRSLLYAFPDDLNKDEKEIISKVGNDYKIIYSTFINEYVIPLNSQKTIINQIKILNEEKIRSKSLPLFVKNTESGYTDLKEVNGLSNDSFPFQVFEHLKYSKKLHFFNPNESINTTKEEIDKRVDAYHSDILLKKNTCKPEGQSPVYQNVYQEGVEFVELQKIGYGVPDPTIKKSNIQCKGCGSLLHCQNESLSGYIPSEVFRSSTPRQMRKLLCQRCYFLKYHNMALNVRVHPTEYLKVLNPITKCLSLAVVVLDLFDIPCSIWPGIQNLLGKRRPVIIVGNKVDLLPPDGPNHLIYVEKVLKECLQQTSLNKTNIKAIKIISAKTGYGIEDLVTLIFKSWRTKGDIYLIGTTNSGKSTLFNALLGSDLCRSAASQLLQRATSSVWPGTTLNLLKFPLGNMTIEKAEMRAQRLLKNDEIDRFKGHGDNIDASGYTQDFNRATLKASIGHTYKDHFFAHRIPKAISTKLKEGEVDYEDISDLNNYGKWCYDTPGTVQSDQIITLLTHDELVKTVPTTIIEPRTFIINTGQTFFIAGLARVDLLYCPSFVRFTIFSSSSLPITVVNTVDASEVYRNYLESGVFCVPCGSSVRFEQWPPLKGRNFFVTGLGHEQSCCDIVLASCGFISPSTEYNYEIDLRCWTPGGRGIYLRKNSILPRSITLRGGKIKGTPEYGSHTTYLPEYERDNVHHGIHGT